VQIRGDIGCYGVRAVSAKIERAGRVPFAIDVHRLHSAMLKARREGRSFQIAVKRPAVGERMALIAKRLNSSRTFEKRSPLAAE
jgi:hypothetical protein